VILVIEENLDPLVETGFPLDGSPGAVSWSARGADGIGRLSMLGRSMNPIFPPARVGSQSKKRCPTRDVGGRPELLAPGLADNPELIRQHHSAEGVDRRFVPGSSH
jgi:hypothetical protein